MLKKTWLGLLAMIFVCSFAARAAEDAAVDAGTETAEMKTEIDERTREILDMPAGVFDLEYDDNGNLVRLKVKGEADVSTSLRGSRGDRQAREKAQREAKASFSKFLNEQVVTMEGDSENYIIREKDGTESAEYLNMSSKLTAIFSESCLRGMVVLLDHIEGEGDRRTATVVMGWSQKLTDAAKGLEKDTKPETKASASLKMQSETPTSKSVTRITKMGDF